MAIQLKELGGTGVMVPEIGLGTWKYRGGVEPLRRGIELGAFLIDTAEMYRTEDVVGQAISDLRDQVFLATKVLGSHLRHDQVLRAAEGSLRLLELPMAQPGQTAEATQAAVAAYTAAGLALFHDFFRVAAVVALVAILPALAMREDRG